MPPFSACINEQLDVPFSNQTHLSQSATLRFIL